MNNASLLDKYYLKGSLNKKYFVENAYQQRYSADDRLYAGTRFYQDFLSWNRCGLGARDYLTPKVDGTKKFNIGETTGESFRRALRLISKTNLQVVYKIVLEEQEIKAPRNLSTREKLYFNDEIKNLLCRGLDELCPYYQRQKNFF